MKIRIIAKKDGFRRAGLAHYGTREYPAEQFSAEQLQALLAEPMLVVELIEEDGDELESPAEEEKESAMPEASASAHDAVEWGSPDSPPAPKQAEASQNQGQAPAGKAAKPTGKKSK